MIQFFGTYTLPLRAFFLVFLFAAANTAASQERRLYVFGNSLVHHLGDSPQTSVPYWITKIAEAAEKKFAVDGQWGLLRNFADDLPPKPNWSIEGARSVWDPERGPFADARTNAIILTPANFIQYQPANRPYDGDNPTGVTPLDASLTVLDWVSSRVRKQKYLIYEGWADMGARVGRFPPNRRELNAYLAYNAGEYHAWYKDYLSRLKQARPGLNIQLIPVAQQLANILTEPTLSGLAASDLFTDDAPHGTPTLYFLAALITYQSLFDDPLPPTLDLPAEVHPLVRENYRFILSVLGAEVSASVAEPAKPVTITTAPTDTPQPANPPLAMGLDGIADWSAQQPFIDVMKSARPWVGHLKGQWGGWTAGDLVSAGALDANGWPTKIPRAVTHIEAFILTNQPEDAVSTAGRYRLTYQGDGIIKLGGLARKVTYQTGEIWFEYAPGEDTVGISIHTTDPLNTGDYIRNIVVVKEQNIPLWDVGVIFNPHWIKRIQNLRAVRFMDWMHTNGSQVSSWAQRPKPNDYTYAAKGAPVEVMVQLANIIGADPWFNMPHKADAGFIRNFAAYVHQNLEPRRKAFVEYSNEVWNYTFPQAQFALQQAEQRWGKVADGWMQYAGMRAAETGHIWREVFGQDADDRLVRVVATHTDWPGLEEAMLQAPLWQKEGGSAPVTEFDAYAVTGYFGLDLGGDLAPDVLQWLAQGEQQAVATAGDLGLKGRAATDYVSNHKYDAARKLATKAILKGSLKHLLKSALPYQSKVAKANGLQLIMYEGGTHVVGLGEYASNEALGAFFTHFNYSAEMAGIYRDLLEGWRAVGGTLFNAFVDVARTSQWGSWGALRHLDDANPRWDALQDFNQQTVAWWDVRAPLTFDHGIFSQKNGILTGTAFADILVAGDGNDVLVSLGGPDKLNGGKGEDQAILKGARADYSVHRQGALTVLEGPVGATNLFNIETVIFSDNPDLVYDVAKL